MQYSESSKFDGYNIAMIAAVSENNVIGLNGAIPWNISDDLKRFNYVTKGHTVVMGRKTYESIPKKYRPLKDRENIILSNSYETDDDVLVFNSIDDILNYIGDDLTYVIGGQSLYHDFMDYAKFLDITKVHKTIDGDTFFPNIDDNLWKLVSQDYNEEISSEGLQKFSYLRYERR